MFIDIACSQEKKYNQNAFGDYFVSKRYPQSGRLIAVLSDGLGSGVKANILACMTATMLLKFIEAEADISNACDIILNSLPVCQVRKIGYATFSAMDGDEDGNVKIVEEGNPKFLWIRHGKVLEPECREITAKKFPGRRMHVYKIKMEPEDRIIFCSDGVTQAALGSDKYKLGLGREGLIDYVLGRIKDIPDISSAELSRFITTQAILVEPERKPMDDISSVCIYFRNPRNAVVFTGPPFDSAKDSYYAGMLFNFKGRKAICGGTTANLVSRELKIPIRTQLGFNFGKLPPVAFMDGIDLVTEGVLTLTKARDNLEAGELYAEDAAGKLVDFLLDSDCITFMVGAKINQAHYDPAMPIEIEIRKNIVKKIVRLLQDKYLKKTVIQYM